MTIALLLILPLICGLAFNVWFRRAMRRNASAPTISIETAIRLRAQQEASAASIALERRDPAVVAPERREAGAATAERRGDLQRVA